MHPQVSSAKHAHTKHDHDHDHKHVSTTLENGRLTVHGTDRKDKLSVKKVGDDVRVMSGDKLMATYPASQVKSLRVAAHGGKDKLDIDVGADIKVHAYGGRGNDTISLANSKDAYVGAVYGRDTINLTDAKGTKIGQGKRTDIINAMSAFSAPASVPCPTHAVAPVVAKPAPIVDEAGPGQPVDDVTPVEAAPVEEEPADPIDRPPVDAPESVDDIPVVQLPNTATARHLTQRNVTIEWMGIRGLGL